MLKLLNRKSMERRISVYNTVSGPSFLFLVHYRFLLFIKALRASRYYDFKRRNVPVDLHNTAPHKKKKKCDKGLNGRWEVIFVPSCVSLYATHCLLGFTLSGFNFGYSTSSQQQDSEKKSASANLCFIFFSFDFF